jgi:hypothetical protein
VLLLGVSIPAYRLIPGWGRPWGLDLQNVYVFHTCAGHDDPYLVTGRQCGDPLGRAMPYPPLMYWALAWMRWVSFPAARWIWASFIALTLSWAVVVWTGPGRLPARWRSLLFGALLVAQFPSVFAMERGNNDTFVVLLWTASVALFLRERRFLAGLAAGLAAAAKLYPAFGCAVLLVGVVGTVVRGGRAQWKPALRLAAGMAVGPAVVTLLFWSQTQHYLHNVLPTFATWVPGMSLHSHSVPAAFGSSARLVSAALVVAWGAAAFRSFERAPVEVFAGGLALSTYVASVSFDYNLVTVYPLLLVLAARAFGDASFATVPAGKTRPRWLGALATLTLGLVAVTAHRGWFEGYALAHVALQIAWVLVAAALVLLVPGGPDGGDPHTPGPAGLPQPDGALQAEPGAR